MAEKKSYVFFILPVAIMVMMSLPSVAGERRVIVGFHQMSTPSDDHAFMVRHKGKLKRRFNKFKALVADLPVEAISDLKNDPDVAYVEEDSIVTAIEPGFSTTEYLESWGVSRIGSESVHAQNVKGAGVKIAVLDTGIDAGHPDLVTNFNGGARFLSSDLDPANQDIFDDSWNSHGTHVAGIIAAEMNGAGVVGVAPEASLYAVKVLDALGAGYLSDTISGIEWAVENKMDIVSMSLGLSTDSQALAIACANAYEAGVLLIAAAGNNYGGDVVYPARYSSVIAVGALNEDDSTNAMSAIGQDMELVAPGAGIYSTTAYGNYYYLTGTSQAAPHVAGVAALMISAGADDLNNDGVADHQDIRLKLHATAFDLGTPGHDIYHGYGLVNAEAAIQDNEETHLRLISSSGRSKDARKVTLKNDIYNVRIASNSIHTVRVAVFENDRFSRKLSDIFRFKSKGRYAGNKQFQQDVNFNLDSRDTTLNVVFIPQGKPGGFADIFIERL